MYLGAIDIGSNAIRLLIKDGGRADLLSTLEEIRPDEYYERVPLKSGNDVFTFGGIQPRTELILTATLCRFANIMKAKKVGAYRACATSAYRDAKNGHEVMERVNRASGLNVEIISGDEEARITRRNYRVPREWTGDNLLYVDVGGGSTELSLIHGDELIYSHSFQIGSMRYVCNNQSADEEQRLDAQVAQLHTKHSNIHYLATGGCVRFMRGYLNGAHGPDTILVREMETVYADLRKLTPEEISEHYDLPLERADILTSASSIFLRIAHQLEANEIVVPSLGVNNGLISELNAKMAGRE